MWDALKSARASLRTVVGGTPKPANFRVSATDGDAGCIKLSLHDEGMDAELRPLHNVCDIHGQNNAYKSQVKLHRGFCGHILEIFGLWERVHDLVVIKSFV